jgi:hypothetical protein
LKIAYLDIETAPNLGYVWGKWEQNVIEFEHHWYILSYAVKWNGGAIQTRTLPDYPLFKKDKENDRDLVKDLHRVFDEADIIIAHNGDAFDIKKANARFIQHGLRPPSQYKTIDTLKVARKNFRFDSNKLDDLGQYLGVGRKLPHTGKHLWLGCIAGNLKSWRTMRDYNAQDVRLLERVFRRLEDWSPTVVKLFSRGFKCHGCGRIHHLRASQSHARPARTTSRRGSERSPSRKRSAGKTRTSRMRSASSSSRATTTSMMSRKRER